MVHFTALKNLFKSDDVNESMYIRIEDGTEQDSI